MKPVVIDTDVVSFLFKSDSRSHLYLPHLEDRRWLISFMTQAELEQWALLSNWGQARTHWLRLFVARFVIVPSSYDLAVRWAEVMVASRRAGRRLETADAWIAATAVLYKAPLITHNSGDYVGVVGLELMSEA